MLIDQNDMHLGLDNIILKAAQHPFQYIEKFEKNNKLLLNVYHIKSCANIISPLRITDQEVRTEKYMNLLLIEGDETCHYTWIKDLNRLLVFVLPILLSRV